MFVYTVLIKRIQMYQKWQTRHDKIHRNRTKREHKKVGKTKKFNAITANTPVKLINLNIHQLYYGYMRFPTRGFLDTQFFVSCTMMLVS